MRKNFLVALFCLFTFFVNIVNAADFEKINVLDNGNIEVLVSSDLRLPKGDIDSDLKVLKDYLVSFSYKDQQNPKKIFLNLTYNLEKNKDYTIIGVDGAEANMSFSIGNSITGEFLNNEKKSGNLNIEKIVISDEKTIEIYYDKELKEEEFIFKVLSDVKISKKIGDGKKTLNISFKTPIEDLTPYIILSEYLLDSDNKKVNLKEKFYDFETGDNLFNVFENQDFSDENLVAIDSDTGNIEEIASKATKTPQTGATTGIMILLTLLISGFIIISMKKS